MTHFALNEFYDFYNRNYGECHTHCNYVFFKGDMLEFEHIGDNRHVNDTGTEYPTGVRMLKEWKISAIARVMNAMVIPSRLSTISQRPDSR